MILGLNILALFLSIYWIKNILLKVYVFGLACACYFLFRDVMLREIQLTGPMVYFLLTSNMFLLSIIAIDCFACKTKNKFKIDSANYVPPSILWSFLMVASYVILNIISESFGVSWDEAANSTGQHMLIRLLFYICYFAAVLRVRILFIKHLFGFWVFIELFLILLLTLFMRDKIFGVFIVLALTVGVVRIKIWNILLICALSFSTYILITFYRWLGALEDLNLDKLYLVWNAVVEVRLEHGLSHDFSSVFSYFMENEKLYGQTYLKLVLLPFAIIFGIDNFPNPIYRYFEISGTDYDSTMLGSSHPTIYGDSFANFGYFGVVVPSLWYIFLLIIIKLSGKGIGKEILYLGSFFLLPLIIRGSVYNGLLMFLLVVIGGFFGTFSLSKKEWSGKFLHKN
jgi:hypothetical protein